MMRRPEEGPRNQFVERQEVTQDMHEGPKGTLAQLQSRDPELAEAIETIRGVVDASNRVTAVQAQQVRIQPQSEARPVGGIYTSAF